jgi:Fur family transcriptional regulator, ferric uptake regulator
MGCEQAFIQQLRERGFRLTPQREMVLAVLHDIEGFATAEEIYSRVQDLSAAVDVSTVYRTLDLLQEFNLVACVEPGDGQRRYELLGLHGPHLHLVCQSCGAVLGADLKAARALAEQLREQSGFVLDLDHLSLRGWCPACAQAVSPQATSTQDVAAPD